MRTKAFGLDIGATTMKIVNFKKESSGFLLTAALTVPTPPKGILSESPLDQEEMAQAIVNTVNSIKISTKYVSIALPENQVYTRVIDMPVISDKELASAIYWEAEQYIPVPLQTVTIDWQILKRPATPAEGSKMQVLLVGAPTLLINKYQRILSLTGLTIVSVETEILSSIRSLILGANFPNTIIVHIGAISTSIAIVKGGIIVFVYTIATGGSAINRAIASDFGFTMQQAEEYKKTYGVSQKMLGGKIGQATMPILMTVINEVKKAMAFYAEKYKIENPLQQILLSGGSSKLPGLNSFFAQHCGIEAAIANPWKVLTSQEVPRDVLDNAPDYTIAVGLAMKDYE